MEETRTQCIAESSLDVESCSVDTEAKETIEHRLIRLLVSGVLYWSIAIVVLGFVRFELVNWGFVLHVNQSAPMKIMMVFHGVMGLFAAIIIRTLPWVARYDRFFLRWLLVIVPFVMLVSMDVIVGGQFPLSVARPDEQRGWANREGWQGEFSNAAIRFNRFGMRGPEVSIKKSDRTKRLLLIGDSVLFGYGVAVEDGIASGVQQLLNADDVQQVRWQVLNAACSGYCATQQALTLPLYHPLFDADLIVLGFCVNDIEEESVFERRLQVRPLAGGLERYLEYSGMFRWIRKMNEHRFLASDFQARAVSRCTLLDMLSGECPDDADRGWAKIQVALSKMVTLIKQTGVPLLYVYNPHWVQLEEQGIWQNLPQHKLASICEELGVPFLDVTPHLLQALEEREAVGNPSLLMIDDVHYSPLGNQEVARAIVSFIESMLSAPAVE